MRKLTLLTLIATMGCLSVYAQEKSKEVKDQNVAIEFESAADEAQAKKDGYDPGQVATMVEQSRKDLEGKIGAEEVAKMVPVSFTYKLTDPKKKEACEVSPTLSIDRNLDKEMAEIKKAMGETYTRGPKGVLFIQWGYNRGFHSKSDITVKTDKGSYTIKDAHGDDRPSPFSLKYLRPEKFSVPQYNLKLGYWFSRDSKFGIGIGTDHMKWVFDPNREYEIEGDYTGELWVKGEKKTFDEVVAGKDASFLLLEHTDGYNYPYIEGLYRERLINTKRFEIDAVAGAGAGILFPKTRTRIADQESTASYRDIDNKFKVAGYAFHMDASLMFKYKQKNGVSYFVKPTVRGVAGKINNALYFGEEGEISQTTIYTLEPSVSVGMEVPLNVLSNPEKRGLRKQLKKLRKMKKLDEKNAKDEITLEQLQKEFEENESNS